MSRGRLVLAGVGAVAALALSVGVGALLGRTLANDDAGDLVSTQPAGASPVDAITTTSVLTSTTSTTIAATTSSSRPTTTTPPRATTTRPSQPLVSTTVVGPQSDQLVKAAVLVGSELYVAGRSSYVVDVSQPGSRSTSAAPVQQGVATADRAVFALTARPEAQIKALLGPPPDLQTQPSEALVIAAADGVGIITAGDDKTPPELRATNGGPAVPLTDHGSGERFESLAVWGMGSERFVASGKLNGEIIVTRVGAPKLPVLRGRDRGCPVRALAPHPNGQTLAAAGPDGSLSFWRWDGKSWQAIGAKVDDGPCGLTIDARQIDAALAWSPDGSLLAWSTGRSIRVLSVSEGLVTPLGQNDSDHKADVASVLFGGDGRTLYSVDAAGAVLRWDVTRLGTTSAP